jgi:cbb3-type cytochrome oxidase subunit 3
MSMDINLLREAVTVASFLAFLLVVVFAAHPANRERFHDAAMAPLQDDEAPPTSEPSPQPSPKAERADAGYGFANEERK